MKKIKDLIKDLFKHKKKSNDKLCNNDIVTEFRPEFLFPYIVKFNKK